MHAKRFFFYLSTTTIKLIYTDWLSTCKDHFTVSKENIGPTEVPNKGLNTHDARFGLPPHRAAVGARDVHFRVLHGPADSQ